jgi:heat shock protein HslJ
MDRYVSRLGLPFLVVIMVAACSAATAPSVPPSASPTPGAPTVDGKTYLSTGVSGAVLVPGTRMRLSFKDGHLNASGGCNSMGGAYTIAAGRLSTTQMMTTEMGCDQPRMQQDSWLAGLLGDSAIAVAGDTLILDDGKIQLTMLDREVADPDRPIEGTRWVLDGVVSGGTASSVPAGVTASMRIAGGRVEVDTGCNTGSGTVDVAADTLTFGPLALTKKACGPGPAAVEGAVTQVLTGTVRYVIEADTLTLDAGGAGLTFRAAA